MICIYLRKSRADLELEAKGEMETLARHKKMLLDVARSMNLPVGQIYEEIVSGETIEARPVVRQLLDEVEQGLWKGVLVVEIERLARGDTIDQGIVARAFKIGRAKIITPTKTYDPDNEFDEEYFEFGLFMSRREYKTINRRIQRGRIASAKEGKFLGSAPPYGYNKVRINGDKGYTLAPNENEAPVVKQIFEMYTNGAGMEIIARHLDSLGIIPRYRSTWSKSTISDILSNPVYTGRLRWSYRTEKKYIDDGKVKKRSVINDNPILVDGLHPALIPYELFEKAQATRGENVIKKTKTNLSLQNPLSGLVYCGLCGHLMTRLGPNKRNQYGALRCPNRYCSNISAPVYLVENKVLVLLKIWLENIRIENERFESKNEQPYNDSTMQLQQKALEDAEQEISKIDLQISNTYDLLEQGIYSIELFTARNKELSERKSSTIKKIEHLKQAIMREQSATNIRLKIPQAVGILESYTTLETAEEKNTVLRSLLNRVEYIKNTPNTRGNLDNDNFEVHLFPKLVD